MTLDGQQRFPLLARLMAGILSKDSERGFSIIHKIHISAHNLETVNHQLTNG